ncbi:ABC transporter permease [Fundidesulfovibrio butyratiphilus]
MNDLWFLVALTLKSSMAVLYAALGEVVCERAGVINLGQEGMMLAGALAGFAVGYATGQTSLGFVAAGVVGAALALIHGLFCVRLGVNQLLSGIALTILGSALASFLGRPCIGLVGPRLTELKIPLLSDLPGVGQALFAQNALVYAGLVLTAGVWWLLERTRAGLLLRACGENPEAAQSMGVNVARVRFAAVAAGGAFSGVGGASLSLAFTPGWKEAMTAGQGWIAVAMVIFAGWRPLAALGGALFFGLLTAAQFLFQTTGQEFVPIWVLRILPYLLTVLTLCLAALWGRRGKAPAALGQPFHPER